MTTSVINIDPASTSAEVPRYKILNNRSIITAIATASAVLLLWGAAAPLADGFTRGGSAAVAERLPTLGARVEDFVPQDRSKVGKPFIGAILAGIATTIGEKVGKVFVGGSWPAAQAWFDRTTHRTDQMIWAGPANIVKNAPVGRDDTVTLVKFEEKSSLALTYKLANLFASFGLDIGKFSMSATAEREDCDCLYKTFGPEVEVWTSGKVRQTWRSEKKQLIFIIDAKMDANGHAAAGNVTGSFGGTQLTRPMIIGSSKDKLQDDERLGK